MGEKLSDLEQFYPDRMASRILGMGDILSLIEKAETQVDEEKARELSQKLKKAEFDYNDFLEQMTQVKNMGGMASIMSMMPGMGQMKDMDIDEKAMDRVEAIILSMTNKERTNLDFESITPWKTRFIREILFQDTFHHGFSPFRRMDPSGSI